MTEPVQLETATLAGGCFWCLEAVFRRLKGVESVISGYMGGVAPNPTYRDVCTGTTGHAEVVQIRFDPAVISYADLLEVFFAIHDPTTLNRQGPDVGTQYRSAIFYHTEAQLAAALESREVLEASGRLGDRQVVTEIVAATRFWAAEEYHQRYYEKRGIRGCRVAI